MARATYEKQSPIKNPDLDKKTWLPQNFFSELFRSVFIQRYIFPSEPVIHGDNITSKSKRDTLLSFKIARQCSYFREEETRSGWYGLCFWEFLCRLGSGKSHWMSPWRLVSLVFRFGTARLQDSSMTRIVAQIQNIPSKPWPGSRTGSQF